MTLPNSRFHRECGKTPVFAATSASACSQQLVTKGGRETSTETGHLGFSCVKPMKTGTGETVF